MKRFILFRVFLLLLFFSFFTAGHLLHAQKIKIKIEDGVTIVYNPKNPVPPPQTPTKLILNEDLTIGAKEGREEYMFSVLRSFDVDEEENIYVLDSKECHIKVFDKKGKYLKTIGKKGQGPGEMQFPYHVHITPQREILVNDVRSRRLLFFSLGGNFKKHLSTAKMTFFLNPKVDSEGNIMGSRQILGFNPGFELKLFDSNLDIISTVATIELPKPPVINPFMPEFCWGVTKDDNFIWGIPTKYELQIVNAQGKVAKKIVKDFDPVKITESEKEEIKKRFSESGRPSVIKIKMPQNHLAFRDLTLDDEGRIFLRTYEKAENGESYYYDVFDREGRHIAKIPLKVQPRVWKKRKMYTIYEDEEGYSFIKRYSVEWK